MKKIITVALVALVIVSLLCVNVSAATYAECVQKTGADLDYYVTYFKNGSNVVSCEYYSEDYLGHVLFSPKSLLREYEIHTNSPNRYRKGDRVKVSFTALVEDSVTEFTVVLAPFRKTFSIDECKTGRVYTWDQPGADYYYEVFCQFDYVFTSDSSNSGLYWIIRSSANWHYFGLSQLSFEHVLSSGTSADTIIDNANSNTDKLINGDGGGYDSSDSTDKIDGTTSDIADAEKDALGGKTDEEIQQEVEDAFEIEDDAVNPEDGEKVSELFMGLLDCFGPEYETLLVISLTLGLAGFIIGRKWSNG